MRDFLRPNFEPNASLYDALVKEAEKRDKRSLNEWIVKEKEAAHLAANRLARKHGLRELTFEEVEGAEASACGHADYMSKWVTRMVEKMRNHA